MFERTKPVSRDQSGPISGEMLDGELLVGSADVIPDDGSPGGNALRAIEWGELTARLGAARDLRLLMRRDSRLNIEATAASFGDAAATYFRAIEDSERVVNPDALEASKASCTMHREIEKGAAKGDARED